MAEAEEGWTKQHTGTDSKPLAGSHVRKFLIANLELEFELTHRNKSPLGISHRKYFAIF